ncbi:MAG: hypothetical protein SGPRY_006141, partial [Prymnesium sp.]
MFTPLMKIARDVSSAAEFVSSAAQQRVASELQSFEAEATRAGATDALEGIERLKHLHNTQSHARTEEEGTARALQFSIDEEAPAAIGQQQGAV